MTFWRNESRTFASGEPRGILSSPRGEAFSLVEDSSRANEFFLPLSPPPPHRLAKRRPRDRETRLEKRILSKRHFRSLIRPELLSNVWYAIENESEAISGSETCLFSHKLPSNPQKSLFLLFCSIFLGQLNDRTTRINLMAFRVGTL